jgi:hypothetical protein
MSHCGDGDLSLPEPAKQRNPDLETVGIGECQLNPIAEMAGTPRRQKRGMSGEGGRCRQA